jgi:hypothetical protein
MTTTVLARIQMRRGLAAEWAAANPVLAQGELAFETDTGRTKIGDGETVYLDLPAYATYDQMVEALADIETARDAALAAASAADDDADRAVAAADRIDLGSFDSDVAATASAKTAAESARDAAVVAKNAAEAANTQAQAASNVHEAVAGNVGTLMAAFGQAWEELQKVMDGQDDNALGAVHVANLAQIIGQMADQINGGRITLAGGTLADPAIRLGTVGIYSSAANTLSVAIAGVERLRVTASGITVYGTVTNA